MNLLAHLESKVWAIHHNEMNAMRLKLAAKDLDFKKIAADFEAKKAAEEPLTAGMGKKLSTGTISDSGVATIKVQGPLFNVEGYLDEIIAYYLGGTSYQDLMADIDAVANDAQIKSVGFFVHSPGGEAFGMPETADKIAALTAKKTTIGYAYGLAASAAYGLISATGSVYADAGAWIGSVGVVTQWADFTGFYESLGVAFEEVTSSNAPFKRLDIRKPEHRAVLMNEIDGIENVFIKLLAKNMGVSVDKVKSDFGQGAVMAAKAAKAAGMINEIGSWDGVQKKLQTQANRANKSNALGAELNEGELDMGFKDEFKNFAAKLGFSVEEKPEAAGEPVNEPSAETETAQLLADKEAAEARAAKAEQEKADLLKQQTAQAETAMTEKAKGFADAELAANRLIPAERESFEASYLQALKDDAANPLPEGKTRAGLIEAIQSKRTPHLFAAEHIAPGVTAKILKGETSEEAKLTEEIDAQVNSYVATVTPKAANLKVVK